MSKRRLNPRAPEWRPLPSLPHLIYHPLQPPPPPLPPSPPVVQMVPLPVPPYLYPHRKSTRNLPPRLQRARFIPKTPPPPPSPPPPAHKKMWVEKGKLPASNNHRAGRGCPRGSVTAAIKTRGRAHSPPFATGSGYPPPSATVDSLRTTVMIKNIPNKLRRDFMLKFLDEYCKIHNLEYDVFYLPMDFGSHYNLGYAFVNFTSVDAARVFKNILQNYKWDEHDIEEITSRKICDITWARVQGKAALMRRFENSIFACDSLEYLPVVLDPPRNGSDPDPPPPRIVGRLAGASRLW